MNRQKYEFAERLQVAMKKAGLKPEAALLERGFNLNYYGKGMTLQGVNKWLKGESLPPYDKIIAAQLQRHELTPTHKLRKALNYVISRETELRVFLEDPQVPMDTNHLEREIRPITLGRKNWLFCWTELGAEHVGLIQSLISTCKLHGINPNTYLTDVLQRTSIHPASQVADLTPRVWKEKFAKHSLRSVLQSKTENKN